MGPSAPTADLVGSTYPEAIPLGPPSIATSTPPARPGPARADAGDICQFVVFMLLAVGLVVLLVLGLVG